MNLYLLVNAGKVFLGYISNGADLACVNFFGWVDTRAHSLLLAATDVLHQVGSELRLADLSVLALS